MTPDHAEATDNFLALGRSLGDDVSRTYSGDHPTDGVWFARGLDFSGLPRIPIAAIEVAVSERGKTLNGSVKTLELVSPAVAIVVIGEDQILRSAWRSGDANEGQSELSAVRNRLNFLINKSAQRFEVWTTSQLRRHKNLMSA